MASARSLHTFNRGKQVNCSYAGLSICRKPQKCRLWISTQSRNCPSKRPDKKANQKQQSNRKNTQPKQKPNKNDRQKWDRNYNGNYMQDDILCVILRMAHKKHYRTNTKHTKGPRWWVREATKLHAETRDPPSQNPRDHKEQPFRRDITPRHFEANTDNAGSQRSTMVREEGGGGQL